MLLVHCFRYLLLFRAVTSTSHFSPKQDVLELIRSLAWKRAVHLLANKTDNHSESTGLESSSLPVGVKTCVGEWIKKKKNHKNNKTQNQPSPKPSLPSPEKPQPHQNPKHMLLVKHRPREVPAGRMMKHTYTSSKHIIHLLPQILSSLSEPHKHGTVTLHSPWHQPLTPQGSAAPTHKGWPKRESQSPLHRGYQG